MVWTLPQTADRLKKKTELKRTTAHEYERDIEHPPAVPGALETLKAQLTGRSRLGCTMCWL
ncbi:hypothetical protein ACFY2Z_24495 [Streptomyces sp. NPDC001222]|uniref:hypothetical protein n=1 Tax=Streptomyces sp. NPDC001222 TaxID=3364548 RepID=UPI00369C5EE4